MNEAFESLIRVRLSTADSHYGGGLVNAARILQLFGDAVTETLIRHDGDEGLSLKMTSEFLAPVHAGDYLEIRAKIVSVGNSSRKIECTAHKIIELIHLNNSAARVLSPPILVARGTDIAVVSLASKSTTPKY